MDDLKTAVILLAHGTKEPDASEPVFRYAQDLARETGMHVEGCLREFIEPSVPTVVGKLVEMGVNEIYVVPFFLFKSGHVTRDITNDLNQEKKKYPKLTFKLGKPICYDASLVIVLKKRLEEVRSS